MTAPQKRFTFRCPLFVCSETYTHLIEPSGYPWCAHGGTHNKQMLFLPGQSSGTPKFILEEKKKTRRKKKGTE